MPNCPHCGDPGAPARGWCLVCGLRVDAPGAAPRVPSAPAPRVEPAGGRPPVVVPAQVAPGFAAGDSGPGTTGAVAEPSLPSAPSGPTEPSGPDAGPPSEGADDPNRLPVEPADSDPPGETPGATADDGADAHEPAASEPPRAAAPGSPAPHATLAIRARCEFASLPWDDPPLTGLLVEFTASGTPLREGVAGPVAHVILALDVSASMDTPDKFPVLREAIRSMLHDLRSPRAAPVLLSVVLFGMGAATVVRGGVASRMNPDTLFRSIEEHRLCFTRYTDVAGALDRAGRIAWEQSRRAPTLPVRVYLLTDGRPQDMPRARESAARIGRVPCDLHALAFGADADVPALQELFAGRRGGTVKCVRRDTISDAFERIAEVAQRVVAVRCIATFELASGVAGAAAFRYRPARVRFPAPAFQGGRRFEADLGTIETGRTYSLLFEVRPPETGSATSDLGTLTLRIPGHGGPITAMARIAIPRTPPGAARGAEDADVQMARDIVDALDDADPRAALRALHMRRDLYEQERRDPGLLALLDRAIHLLEVSGSLDELSPGEHATLLAHTCTSGSDGRREPAGRPERVAGGAAPRRPSR